jgi:hypothetical protein
MAGATSIIQLILKKWGDDAAGAAKELEEKVGFPESVANRIATGELPMDEASRVARREARYADEGLVHVNRGGIEGEGFDNSRLPTDDPDTPFNAHWFTADPHPTTAFRKQGSDDPLTYTPVVLEKGRRGDWRDVVNYGESMGEDAGYGTEFREGLLDNGVSDIVVRGGDRIDQATIDALPVDGRLKIDPDNKYGDRRNSLVKNEDGSLGFYEGSEHILDYDDLADYQRFNPEIKDVAVLDNTIIRSPNAAFDPEYTGSNIMGGLALPAAAGLLAAGQSEESDASLAGLAKRGLELAKRPYGFELIDKTRIGERGEIAGRMDLDSYVDGDPMTVSMVELYDNAGDRRGTGIGSLFYDAVEEATGGVIEPSRAFTEDGARFWAKRDPYAMQELLDADLLDSDSALNVQNAIGAYQKGNADPRLLAGIAGTTAAGLAAPMIKDSGMISSPRSETLFDLTMGARDVERRLEGSPASLLFPSGLVEYLETVNRREEDPNAMTRGMALLDVLPF